MASRKSERLSKQQTPQINITPIKKTPKKCEKPNSQTPLRRSGRGKKGGNSLESMFFDKGANLFEENRKNPKEKSLNMLNIDEKKDGFVKDRGVKRRKINGKSFRGLFRSQETKKNCLDDSQRKDAPSEVDCDVSQLSDSKLMEPRDEEGDESLRELINDTEEECLKGFEDGVVILASDSQSSVGIISRDVCEADLSNSRTRGSTEKESNEPPDVVPSVATNVVGETLIGNTCFSAEFSQELVNDSEEECLKEFEYGVVILASDSQGSVAVISRDIGEADLSNSRSRSSTEKGSNEPPDIVLSVAANVVGETLTANTCFSAEFSPELEIVESDSIGVPEGLNALKKSNQSIDPQNSEPSKFVEYWVPAQISNLQLEQYCATLLSNSEYLCSCLKKDFCGTHREILNTIRKCCDHPYLVDSTLQGSITEGLPLSDILDVGIKASGKLQLLDMILSEIKARQLRVLVLFQPIVGSAIHIGDILEDFVSQRFGQNSYERVDKHHAKKQAAGLNRFNKKENGQFVFLLERGACVPSIKLASVDTVVMFDSDWNPGNDLKALQKLSIDTQFPQIKVFRLYSACTSEEKALILAKQDIHLNNDLQNISRINAGTLLSWGASNLFNRLEEFHANESQSMFADIAFEDLLANNVLREFQATLTAESVSKDPENCLISKVCQLRGVFRTNIPLLAESKTQSAVGEEPHIFWKGLLAGRSPCWRYPCFMSRNRKRVKNFDGTYKDQETDSDSVKKHRKVIDNGVNSAPHKEPAAGHEIRHENQSLPVPAMGSGLGSPSPASSLNSHDKTYLPEGNQDQSVERSISNQQKSIHIYLTAQMEKVCEILAFEDNIKSVLHLFLEYVVENHRVSKENVAIFQALQISLCWIAASMLKKQIDRQESLKLAKQKMNFECSDEQAECIYKMLRRLKRTFLQQPNIIKKLQELINPTSTEEQVLKDILDTKTLEPIHIRSQNQETAHEENLTDPEPYKSGDQSYNHESGTKSIICEKQQEEIDEFHKCWEAKRLHLEKEKSVRAAFIRQMHSHNIDARTQTLKMLDTEFSRKLEKHKKLMEAGLKNLKAKHLSAKYRETENRFSDDLLVNQTDDANGTGPSSDQATLVADSHEAIDSVNHAISVEYLPLGSDSCGSACQSFSDGCTPFQATETTHQVEEPPNHSQHQPQVRETLRPSSSSDIRPPMIGNNQHNQPPASNQGGEPTSGLFVSPHCDVQAVVVDNGSDQRINEVLQASSQLRLSNSRISLQADPLQIELEKLRKEIQEATKGHENLKSQLRSDCEKEIEEVVSEIRNKYKAKVQDAEAMFQLKTKALHSNVHKVSLNKILADGIRAECTKSVDVWPSGVQRHQVMSSGSMHQLQQIPLQLTRGCSNVGSSSAVNTIDDQQATSVTLPGEPRLATPQVGASSRPPIINSISSPQTNARVRADFRAVTPHLQSAQADVRAVAPHLRPSGADIRVEPDFRAAAPHLQSARADVRAIAPHLRPAGANFCAAAPHLRPAGANLRAAAPHLQTIRPPVSVPGPSHSSLPLNQPSRTLPSQVLHAQPRSREPLSHRSSPIQPSEPSPRIPLMPAQVRLPSQTSGPHISLSGSQIVGPTSHHSTRPSELELLRDIDRRFKAVLPNPMVQGSVPRTIVSTGVVCLSDDE